MENYKILVVDDDHEIADAIEIYLKSEGYEIFKAYNGLEALEILNQQKIHCILMDVMMPKMDGIQAIMHIRETSNIPIIILSAKSEDMDKVLGLNIGADDYITKPFNPLEMIARVKSQLRRYMRYNSQKRDDNIIDFQGLILNCSTHECTLYVEKLNLTPTEFSILQMLCENRGKVISSQDLFESIWKEKYFESNNTVMVHILNLRKKLESNPAQPALIRTIWGKGYQID